MAFDLNSTYAVLYMGVVVSSMLYGLTCLQTFLYFQSYRKDFVSIRALVLTMLIVDSVHQAFIIHAGFYYLIVNFGNTAAVAPGNWSVLSAVFLSAISGFLVECFMVWRLYRLSHGQKWLCASIFTLIFVDFGTNIAWPIQALRIFKFTVPVGHQTQILNSTAIAGFSLTVISDAVLAGVLVYYLYKSRTGFKHSDSIITRLILYTVTTGLLTSLNALIDLIVYVVIPHDFYFIFFNFMTSKLYCNSLLATLNSRASVRSASQGTDLELVSFTRALHVQDQHKTNTVPVNVHVNVHTFKTEHEPHSAWSGEKTTLDMVADTESQTNIGEHSR